MGLDIAEPFDQEGALDVVVAEGQRLLVRVFTVCAGLVCPSGLLAEVQSTM